MPLLEKNIFTLRRRYICHECLQKYRNERLDHKYNEDVKMQTEHLDNLVKNQTLNISETYTSVTMKMLIRMWRWKWKIWKTQNKTK